MIAFKIKAKVIEDLSGVGTEVPTIITDQGVIESVTKYLLRTHLNGASQSKMTQIVQAILLLIEFMGANEGLFDDPERLFEVFSRRLYSGTIDKGIDPSGLYWMPISTAVANRHIRVLTDFTDWLAYNDKGKRLNKIRKATPHEARLKYAAWFRKNNAYDFLGHIKKKGQSEIARKALTITGKRTKALSGQDAKGFPDKLFLKFLKNGLGGAKDRRIALRDQLIVLLMHGAGFRISEVLTLWVTDVFEDPNDKDKVQVRIFDEVDGYAPNKWKSRSGTKTRKAYLKEKYALSPRRDQSGSNRLGWKSSVKDYPDGSLEAFWFDASCNIDGHEYYLEMSKTFLTIWNEYQRYRALTQANHPYAFVSFKENYLGKPLTFKAFQKSYERALHRIDLVPSQNDGLNPHAHRHNYARRLERAGMPMMVIKKAMHHSSIESQQKYTTPSIPEIKRLFDGIEEKLCSSSEHKQCKNQTWSELIKYGFEDVDPLGITTRKFSWRK